MVGVPLDGDGLDVDELENRLGTERPTIVYTVPSYHNPAGQTMPESRRRRLVELSREHGFVIAADEVYQMLAYDEEPPPAMGTMISDGNVLSLGTFSKILAPGLRLGWIQSSPELMDRMLQNGAVCSGGSFNHFSSMVVKRAIESGDQDAHIEHLHATFSRRIEAMDSALREHVGDAARWLRPKGGYFFWLELDEDIDAEELRTRADEYGVGFEPGSISSHREGLRNCLRLCFAMYDEDTIREGVERLASLLKS
jgi:DNA-binding transcriptional MocR family regulator